MTAHGKSVFGSWRFLLSMMVMLPHLWPEGAPIGSGAFAVFGFYVLSGFLMTKIINGPYGHGLKGFACYLLNRGLRIFPPYWAILIFAIAVIGSYPDLAAKMRASMRFPVTDADWFLQLSIVGLLQSDTRLIPPAWSLDIELVYYLLIGAFLGRNRRLGTLWFIGSWGTAVYLLARGTTVNEVFLTYYGVSAAFSTGSMIHHFQRNLRRISGYPLAIGATSFFLVQVFLLHRFFRYKTIMTFGLYEGILLSALVVCSLGAIRPSTAPAVVRRLDKELGHLAYPIFLLHWPMSVAIVALFFHGNRPEGGTLFFVSIPAVIAGAAIVHYTVEHPLERLRAAVRQRAGGVPPISRRGAADHAV